MNTMIPESEQLLKTNYVFLIACFFLSFVSEGLQRLSGLFFLEIIGTLSLDRQTASLPFILNRSVAYLIAAFSRQLCKKKAAASVILWGVLLCTTGVGLCFLVTDIILLSLFWGLIFGSGCGMVSPYVRMEFIKQHKQSSVSASASSAGLSFSSIILPPFLDILIYNYGINGSFFIFSAIILNYMPLSLLATYNIPFHRLYFKWRIRKRSKKYSPSSLEQNIGAHNFAISESFTSVFEPDIIQKISPSSDPSPIFAENSKFSYPVVTQITNTITSQGSAVNTEISTLSEVSEEQTFTDNVRFCNGPESQIINEIKNYEKSHQPFEENSTDQITVSDSEPEKTIAQNNKQCQTYYPCKAVVSNIKQETTQHLDDKKVSVVPEESLTKSYLKESTLKPETANNTDKFDYKSKVTSVPLLPKQPLLDIKVHVVECIFTSSAQHLYEKEISESVVPKRSGYRKHSNSLPSGCYSDIDFTTFNFIKSNKECCSTRDHQLNPIPTIGSILEVEENDVFKTLAYQNKNNNDQKNEKTNVLILKAKKIFKTLNILTEPAYVFIILTLVVYEFILVALLMIFADVGIETRNQDFSLKWILIAFGMGGLFGRLSFSRIVNCLADRTYLIAAAIFVLNGLAAAGVLWSTDLILVTVFYAIIGVLEIGVMQIIPKLILLYLDTHAEPLILSTSSFLSAIAVLIIPYVIDSASVYSSSLVKGYTDWLIYLKPGHSMRLVDIYETFLNEKA
ncbi:uncharacterized protein LOC118196674 [Stegodyphus dumicola]|uniref:uncharacterized protein LOC118196674 n=1 Tax=Stegodyphus dumicola TaxID=202533 RepID=UPI0015B05E2C|nr:uncharacterized protein LOC118196674 [Stegodyphus dumicola]